MNPSIQDIFSYHNETKHAPGRYARSLGYMDWANQPDPFRHYEGSERIELPLALEHPIPPYHLLFDNALPSAPLVMQSISQLLQFSLGIAANKAANGSQWSLRCNASSGNLHPTEAYLILPPITGLNESCGLYHYNPQYHALEKLCSFESALFDTLPKGSFLLALSSITWRETWKYGERAFRYCNLDAGHAMQAVDVSAKALGWKTGRITPVQSKLLNTLLGFDQADRYDENEPEYADMLLCIGPDKIKTIDLETLNQSMTKPYLGKANRLSRSHQPWEMIERIEKATQTEQSPALDADTHFPQRAPSMEAKAVIMQRRSAQLMNPEKATISKVQFLQLLQAVKTPLYHEVNTANLVIFVHAVEGLKSGLYILIRNPDHLRSLKRLMRPSFDWEEIEQGLYALEYDDFRSRAQAISCTQTIAAEGAFSLGMLCEFSEQINTYGPHRYKELYWECGAIGQQLYLEATSLGLSATGIGCYLDDSFHYLLGLDNNLFQSLYHFTVGRAIRDSRLQEIPLYQNRA